MTNKDNKHDWFMVWATLKLMHISGASVTFKDFIKSLDNAEETK